MRRICFIINVFVFFLLEPVALTEKCETPNGEEAECVPMCSCPILIDALMTLQPRAIEFVKKSRCGQARDRLVCCGSSGSYVTSTTPASAANKMDLLPSRRFCGYQRSDDYFHNHSSPSLPTIDEFPWSAALVYDENGTISIKCSGTLISDRYVLTLASCIVPLKNYLVWVRLGEYSVEKDEDCIRNGRFDDECADPIRDFGIEKRIAHGEFNFKKREHNIGLIRLNKTVTYSDFVRPICLPFPGTKFAKIGDLLYQSGWGNSWYVSENTDVKKKITVVLLPNEKCTEIYKSGINVTDYYSCTLEHTGSYSVSCQGDGGGPVMFAKRNQWHLEGLIAYGKGCGFGVPGLNVKVVKYLDWILESI